MGIAAGIGHFFESILEVIQGIFAAILHAFQFVLQTFVDLGKGAVNFVEGTLGFAFRKFSHSSSPSFSFLPPLVCRPVPNIEGGEGAGRSRPPPCLFLTTS